MSTGFTTRFVPSRANKLFVDPYYSWITYKWTITGSPCARRLNFYVNISHAGCLAVMVGSIGGTFTHAGIVTYFKADQYTTFKPGDYLLVSFDLGDDSLPIDLQLGRRDTNLVNCTL